jgi:nitroreductase
MNMKFLELAQRRYSVRNYLSKPVEKEKLEYVLESARIAPSAVNFQPWQFIVLTEDKPLKEIMKVYVREWFKSIPACIVVLGDHNLGWRRSSDGKDHTDIDVSIAITHITLAATEVGLGTCWVCNFDVNKCIEQFNLPDNLEPIALIPIGYPENEDIPDKKRKSAEEIVKWEGFSK